MIANLLSTMNFLTSKVFIIKIFNFNNFLILKMLKIVLISKKHKISIKAIKLRFQEELLNKAYSISKDNKSQGTTTFTGLLNLKRKIIGKVIRM